MPKRSPSPSLVVACLALAIALGGTAYAATLPTNSVGSAQVKPNSLTGGDIKEATLQGVVLGKGQVVTGNKFVPVGTDAFRTIVTIPGMGRLEGNCWSGGIDHSFVRFVNRSGSLATIWVQGNSGSMLSGVAAGGNSAVAETTAATPQIWTWVIRTEGAKKRMAVAQVAVGVGGTGCDHVAVAERVTP